MSDYKPVRTPEFLATAALQSRIRYRKKHPIVVRDRQPYGPRLSPEERQLRKQDYERDAWRRFKVRLRRYGLTLDQYHSLLEKQDFLCAMCAREDRMDKYGGGNVPYDNSNLAIDHDHVTLRVRGLLCKGCNWAIGYLEDSPALAMRAASYLEVHNNRRSQV